MNEPILPNVDPNENLGGMRYWHFWNGKEWLWLGAAPEGFKTVAEWLAPTLKPYEPFKGEIVDA